MKSLLAIFAAMAPMTALANGEAPQGMGAMGQFVFLGGFLLIFYFLLWRPQSKRQKEHKNLMASISKNDEVVTAGGILGKVIKVTDEFVLVEVAEGVEMPIQKVAVTSVLPKGTIKEVKTKEVKIKDA